MDVIHVKEADFEATVLRNTNPVICDFWAEWCGPCRMLGPELEAIAAARSDVVVAKVDVGEAPAIAARYGIDAIPAVLLFRGGECVARSVGFLRANDLVRALGL